MIIEMLDGEPPNFSDSQIVAMDKIKVNPSPSPAKAEVKEYVIVRGASVQSQSMMEHAKFYFILSPRFFFARNRARAADQIRSIPDQI